MLDIDHAAAIAVRVDMRMPGSRDERWELAWSAAAEHWCATRGLASRRDLVAAALDAMTTEAKAGISHHGVSARHGGGAMSAPRFVAYWTVPATPVEERVDESLTLAQIWPRLTRPEQDAVTAAAVLSPREAAAALGVPYGTFSRHLAEARARFLRLWHEGERPSRLWAGDRPAARRNPDSGRRRAMALGSRQTRARASTNRAIRAWAAENGIPCKASGRISPDLVARYNSERET